MLELYQDLRNTVTRCLRISTRTSSRSPHRGRVNRSSCSLLFQAQALKERPPLHQELSRYRRLGGCEPRTVPGYWNCLQCGVRLCTTWAGQFHCCLRIRAEVSALRPARSRLGLDWTTWCQFPSEDKNGRGKNWHGEGNCARWPPVHRYRACDCSAPTAVVEGRGSLGRKRRSAVQAGGRALARAGQ